MNKTIKKSELLRIKKCVIDLDNKWNCYTETKIAVRTIDKILERGYAKVSQIERLLAYCDKVEGIVNQNKASAKWLR